MTGGRKTKVPLPPGRFRSLFDGSVRSFNDDSESCAKRRKLLATERAAAVPAVASRCCCEVCLALNGSPIVEVGLRLQYESYESDDDLDIDSDWCTIVSQSTASSPSITVSFTVKATEPVPGCPNARKKWQNKYDKRRQIQEEWLKLPWVGVAQVNGQVNVVRLTPLSLSTSRSQFSIV